jgi:hypothetical protein
MGNARSLDGVRLNALTTIGPSADGPPLPRAGAVVAQYRIRKVVPQAGLQSVI